MTDQEIMTECRLHTFTLTMSATPTTVRDVITWLRRRANARNVAGMSRYGISPRGTLGLSIPPLRNLARKLRPNHRMALGLWATGIHEARILASMIDDPLAVSRRQMDSWLADVDSWDVCDQLCANLLERVPLARHRMKTWARRKSEFVRRAGFVLLARIAVSDKGAPDALFEEYLRFIVRNGADSRNLVRKAVNWAIRQIGKRNRRLQRSAIASARLFARHPDPAVRWIGLDALRELTSPKVALRLRSSPNS